MADQIVTSLVGPAVEEVGRTVVATMKRQFNYLCCFPSNIQSLRDEARNLENARIGLQMQVDTAERNAKVIVPGVKDWLTEAEKQTNITEMENEIPKVRRGCLNMKSRYSLSRKAKKATEAMKELRESCNFNHISEPAPPAAMVPPPLEPTNEFQSRKQIEEDIMEALRGKEVNILGICGMGGVGKTTMAKKIMNRVMEEHLFDEVVMVVVSQPVDMSKIQHEIAESLGLKFQKETLPGRAHELRTRLMGKTRILMVLDDVWERLNLEDLGIPCKSELHGGCTILLTSRNRDVLRKMDAQMVCAVDILSEKEAWLLFKEKVGTCVDDLNLRPVALQVAKECKGLPIALVTVGSALKDEQIRPIWEDALHQLRSSNPISMPDVLGEVYNPLKLSYKSLGNRQAEFVFLLCCLFPEDSDISLECLTFYSMGSRTFEGLGTLEQNRHRVFALVSILKSRSLLLDGVQEHHVRMHDVVRDVAIFIASEEGLVDLEINSMNWSRGQSDCKWISLFPKETIQLSLNAPNLHLFMMHSSNSKNFEIRDSSFFDGIKELEVLSFKNILLDTPAQTIQLLKNLRTLHLVYCNLEAISVVGELLSLEILCCRSCGHIDELPVGIGRLNRLKLLEFSNCQSLKTIAPGIITKLIELEELNLLNSFKSWGLARDAEGQETMNVSLDELQSLSKLTCLKIEVQDCTLVTKEMCLSSNIAKYDLKFGQKFWGASFFRHERTMRLELPGNTTLGSWIHVLVRSTEDLWLVGDGSNNLDLSQARNVKSLKFEKCSTVKKLVKTTTTILPVLEELCMNKLRNLEEICEGPIGNVSLRNIRKVQIYNCDKLRHLFSLTMASDALSQLESIKIGYCGMIEQVFSKEEEEENINEKDGKLTRRIVLPQLMRLKLDDLPSLTTFCGGIESIEFPMLARLQIYKCPKMISFVSCVDDNDHQINAGSAHDGDSLHLFCSQRVKLDSLYELDIENYDNISNIWCRQIPVGFYIGLEILSISNCGNSRSLFSCSIVENLVNLKTLNIGECKEMVEVIADDQKMLHGKSLLFPSLQKLILRRLPKLEKFCECKFDLDLPWFREVFILQCPRVENLILGSLSLSNLESTNVDRERINKDDDLEELNGDIRQRTGSLGVFPIFGSLWLSDLPNFKEIHDVLIPKGSNSFIHLKSLRLSNLPALKHLSSTRNQNISPSNLSEISISNCGNLRNLFSLTMARVGLSQLENLYILNCAMIEEVFSNDDEENVDKQVLSLSPS